MSESVLCGSITYVVENPIAVAILKQSIETLKTGDSERAKALRFIAAKVEEGTMLEDIGLLEAGITV